MVQVIYIFVFITNLNLQRKHIIPKIEYNKCMIDRIYQSSYSNGVYDGKFMLGFYIFSSDIEKGKSFYNLKVVTDTQKLKRKSDFMCYSFLKRSY